LAHHFIVWAAAKRAGVSAQGQYAILGDDIVIRGRKLGEAYAHLVINVLGCDISLSKSHLSDDLHSRGEFAKRLALNGDDLTPLP